MKIGLFITLVVVFIFLTMASCSTQKRVPKSGREFRSLYPNRHTARGRALLRAFYQRKKHQPSYQVPLIRFLRQGLSTNSLSRRSLPYTRLRKAVRKTRLADENAKKIVSFRRYSKPPITSLTKNGNNQKISFGREPLNRFTGTISRLRQNDIIKCRNIKSGKCCNGWTKDSFTGYCIPSCEKSCVHGTCENEVLCKCVEGFTGPLCNLDINECAQNPCEHGCYNVYGSYRCVCNHGYRLNEDGKCSRIHPCDLKKCDHECYMNGEDAKCVCPKGYRVGTDGKSCKDINECIEREIKCHGADEQRSCKNTPGSYICACKTGYFYHRYFKTCSDSNECLTETNNCNVTISKCVNTKGGYRCECRDNYFGERAACDVPQYQDKASPR